MSGEGFLLDIHSFPHYLVILKVSDLIYICSFRATTILELLVSNPKLTLDLIRYKVIFLDIKKKSASYKPSNTAHLYAII